MSSDDDAMAIAIVYSTYICYTRVPVFYMHYNIVLVV